MPKVIPTHCGKCGEKLVCIGDKSAEGISPGWAMYYTYPAFGKTGKRLTMTIWTCPNFKRDTRWYAFWAEPNNGHTTIGVPNFTREDL